MSEMSSTRNGTIVLTNEEILFAGAAASTEPRVVHELRATSGSETANLSICDTCSVAYVTRLDAHVPWPLAGRPAEAPRRRAAGPELERRECSDCDSCLIHVAAKNKENLLTALGIETTEPAKADSLKERFSLDTMKCGFKNMPTSKCSDFLFTMFLAWCFRDLFAFGSLSHAALPLPDVRSGDSV